MLKKQLLDSIRVTGVQDVYMGGDYQFLVKLSNIDHIATNDEEIAVENYARQDLVYIDWSSVDYFVYEDEDDATVFSWLNDLGYTIPLYKIIDASKDKDLVVGFSLQNVTKDKKYAPIDIDSFFGHNEHR